MSELTPEGKKHEYADHYSGTQYTVTCVQIAQNQLANLWMQAPDPPEVTYATNDIDCILKFDAHAKGHQVGQFRVLTVPPLSVLYHVSEDDRMVTVFQVRRV